MILNKVRKSPKTLILERYNHNDMAKTRSSNHTKKKLADFAGIWADMPEKEWEAFKKKVLEVKSSF